MGVRQALCHAPSGMPLRPLVTTPRVSARCCRLNASPRPRYRAPTTSTDRHQSSPDIAPRRPGGRPGIASRVHTRRPQPSLHVDSASIYMTTPTYPRSTAHHHPCRDRRTCRELRHDVIGGVVVGAENSRSRSGIAASMSHSNMARRSFAVRRVVPSPKSRFVSSTAHAST